jgi:hypothetical protein
MARPSNPPEPYFPKTTLTELEKKDKVFELIKAGIRSGTLTFGNNAPSYYVTRAREYVELIYGK